MKSQKHNKVILKSMVIDTYHEVVIFLHPETDVCKSEGFEVQKRIRVTINNISILATLNTIEILKIIKPNEAVLSKSAWKLLNAQEGDEIILSHPPPLESLSYVREKIYGHDLDGNKISKIIDDVTLNNYSDIELAAFLTACSGYKLSDNEIINLTGAMVNAGEKLHWDAEIVVDKHCVGGLPGNRTTLIVVPIIAAFGLTIPKTSSRAITSPAGTSDTMEVLAPVDLDIRAMRAVVEQENGCIVWGGSVTLSPADDILIRVERALNLDSTGQLVASILSKKIAAGATHVLIDMPIGITAKIRNQQEAEKIQQLLEMAADKFALNIKILMTDGSQPVGRGVGPALEAFDVLEVLQNLPTAPKDLRDRSLNIAAGILELSGKVKPGTGKVIATQILDDGRAWKKFQAICAAQGGMREPPVAAYNHVVTSQKSGTITTINNRSLSKLATLAGAPNDKAAGVYLHTHVGQQTAIGEPLFTIFAESRGELRYALSSLQTIPEIVKIEEY